MTIGDRGSSSIIIPSIIAPARQWAATVIGSGNIDIIGRSGAARMPFGQAAIHSLSRRCGAPKAAAGIPSHSAS